MTFACLVLIMTQLKFLFRKPLRLSEKRVRSLLLPWLAYLVMQLKLRLTLSHNPLVRSSCQTTPPLLPTYSVRKGRQSGNERRGERTGIRGKRIDTLFLGVASRDH